MIMLNGRQFCENCFANISGEPCPVCGFSRAGYTVRPGVMPVGSILTGKYVIGQVIGQGGFGITYRAYDIKSEQIIAIKEYYPSSLAVRMDDRITVAVTDGENDTIFRNGIEKFYDEARLVSRFNGNPNIVSVYEFFYENNTAYFAMEFLEGITLKSYVEKNGVLSPSQALYIFSEVSSALMIAHSANILHRDISPDNIMLCKDGNIKLIDFGAARQVLAENPKSMSVILKAGFAPLEQYQKRGNQGPWTDIYSLGASVYYALTRDFLDDPMTRLEDDRDFEVNKYEIEEQLWNVIKKSANLKIIDRYQSAFELKEALKEIKYKPTPVTVKPAEPETPAGEAFGSDMNAANPAGMSTANLAGGVTFTGNTANGSVPNVYTANRQLYSEVTNNTNGQLYSEVTNGMSGQIPSEGTNGTRKHFKFIPLIIAGSVVLTAVIIIIAIIVYKQNYSRDPYLPVIENPTEKPAEKVEKIQIGNYTYDSSIKEIDLSGMGLTNYDIRNLPQFKNLKKVILNDNKINDLSVLNQMPQLEEICFDDNRVSDISFVKGMKNLKHISFGGNMVSDLSPLDGTSRLEYFWAAYNRINDLSPLKENKNMIVIMIDGCPIGGDISALSGMTGLTWLSAEECGITDLYSLRRCQRLEYVYLSNNSIESVSPLKNCTGLIELWIENNTARDKESFINSFAGITIADDGLISVQLDDGVDGYIFASEDAAREWSDTIIWGNDCSYQYTYYD